MQVHETIITGKQSVLEYMQRNPEKVDSVLIQENKKGKEVKTVVQFCRHSKVKYHFVPKAKLDKLTQTKHQGFLAKIFAPGFVEVQTIWERLDKAKFPLLLCLDQLQDSGSIGTLARTLYAFDGAGLIIPRDRTAYLGERAFKTSAGALSTLPVAQVTNLARFLKQCQERNYYIYYAGLGENCFNLFEVQINWPTVLVLGNEEKGVRPGISKECLLGLTIPMFNYFNSINVAQAGAIIMGELLRRRLGFGDQKD